MKPEHEVIAALLKVYFEYYDMYLELDDIRYLKRTQNCVELILDYFSDKSLSAKELILNNDYKNAYKIG
ncbi:hypothetical protein [Ammoniphilus sp. 3BR4]|uniref:hypothetical protein n=1 Tax=Ammoniphilus sp. 3BR4 TaxID=3158265 RepID=UPI00346654BE